MKLDLSKSFDRNKAEVYLKKLTEKGAKAEIKEFIQKRNLSQNSYLHVCFASIAKETEYRIDEAKIVLKREYGLVYEKNGQKFLRSTATLDKLEISDFIDWLREFSLTQLGTYIPTSEEYIQHQFEIEKDLEQVK